MKQGATEVTFDVRPDGDVWITIDRPHKHNALARSTLAALASAITTQADAAATRFIVLRGAGDAYFAAGGDLIDLAEVRSVADTEAMAEAATAALDAIRRCPVPVLAYVNGDALGGGAELAVACDLRLVALHARIGYVHGRLAITPAWGGGTDLVRLIGPARAMQMMARGELIAAQQALAWGLADAVVDGGANGADLAAFLAPLRQAPPQLLRAIKAQIAVSTQSADYMAQRAVERRSLVETWTHADHWAAVERFLARG